MQVPPAIDIKERQAVRLFRGDSSQKTVANPDILGQTKIPAQAGIELIYIVNLDRALDGRATNRDLIAKSKQESGLGVGAGGGIRTLEQVKDYLAVGIDRVIIGSMAVRNPDFVKAALGKFGNDKTVVDIDTKSDFVATESWLETSNVDYISLAKVMEKMGVTPFVYTDVDRNDTLTGLDFEHYERLVAELTTVKAIAFGGVTEENDSVKLQEIGVAGIIVGRTYYNDNISLGELKAFGE